MLLTPVLASSLSMVEFEKLEPRRLLSTQPTIAHVGLVRPDLLAVTIEEAGLTSGEIVPYVAEPGDRVEEPGPLSAEPRWVWQDANGNGFRDLGEARGVRVGGDQMRTLDTFTADRVDVALLDDPTSYTLSTGEVVEGVDRKSTPIESTDIHDQFWYAPAPMRHTVYLDLASPVTPGQTITVDFADPNLSDLAFTFDPNTTVSPALHVNQVGFRPDDPKVAHLSFWAGSGGEIDYAGFDQFDVIDAAGNVVHSGPIVLDTAKTDPDDNRGLHGYPDGTFNKAKVDVRVMDFTDVEAPGTYRVRVDGLGVTHGFEIADDIWATPFDLLMDGIHAHRSGIEIRIDDVDGGQWTRPRNFHPDDGVVIHDTTATFDDGQPSFDEIVAGRTDRVVEVWGGYHDAGDYDRNANHLWIAHQLLDLYELFPDTIGTMDLGVAASGDVLPGRVWAGVDLPDLLDEAMWGLDFFRRLQQRDGGVRGGIESAEHPRTGETSWLETLDVFAYAPDALTTYRYAAIAAKAAGVLDAHDADLASEFLISSQRAYDWARAQSLPADDPNLLEAVEQHRAWAAAELYRVTDNKRYHADFRAWTALDPQAPWQTAEGTAGLAAAWAYASIDPDERADVDPALHAHAGQALINAVDNWYLRDALDKASFGALKNAFAPHDWGTGTHPQLGSEAVARAFVLSGDTRYFDALVKGLGIALGDNPKSMSFITGLGEVSPRNILHLDSHYANQPTPAGIAVYGSFTPRPGAIDWPIIWHLNDANGQAIYPNYYQWPILENFHEFLLWAPMTEYTVWQTTGTDAFLTGFLTGMADLGRTAPALPPTPSPQPILRKGPRGFDKPTFNKPTLFSDRALRDDDTPLERLLRGGVE